MTKRDAILDRLATFILDQGLEAATLRAMGRAADQSDRMLLYYFKDKEDIISQTLDLLAGQLTDLLEAHKSPNRLRKDALHALLDGVVLSDALWPYLRLWLDLASRAARHDPFFAPLGHAIGQDFHGWIEAQLLTPDPTQRRAEATEIMIGLKGIIVLKSIGMQALVEELV